MRLEGVTFLSILLHPLASYVSSRLYFDYCNAEIPKGFFFFCYQA